MHSITAWAEWALCIPQARKTPQGHKFSVLTSTDASFRSRDTGNETILFIEIERMQSLLAIKIVFPSKLISLTVLGFASAIILKVRSRAQNDLYSQRHTVSLLSTAVLSTRPREEKCRSLVRFDSIKHYTNVNLCPGRAIR